MTYEENIIRQHAGQREPFLVPEGYFEGFTEKMMARLPRAEQAGKVRLPLWRRATRFAAAAMLAGLCVGLGTTLYTRQASSSAEALLSAQNDYEMLFSGDELNEVLDYELLNNQQIGYYLTEAY